MNKFLMKIISVYQMLLSPLLGNRCRYYPCCSHYAKDALIKHGPAKGLVLAAYRLLRCNPLSDGGVDPVPETFSLIKPKEVNQ